MTHDLLTHVTHKTSVLLAFAKEADIHEIGNSLLKHPFQIRHVRAFAFSSAYAISRRKCVESTFVFAWHKLHMPKLVLALLVNTSLSETQAWAQNFWPFDLLCLQV